MRGGLFRGSLQRDCPTCPPMRSPGAPVAEDRIPRTGFENRSARAWQRKHHSSVLSRIHHGPTPRCLHLCLGENLAILPASCGGRRKSLWHSASPWTWCGPCRGLRVSFVCRGPRILRIPSRRGSPPFVGQRSAGVVETVSLQSAKGTKAMRCARQRTKGAATAATRRRFRFWNDAAIPPSNERDRPLRDPRLLPPPRVRTFSPSTTGSLLVSPHGRRHALQKPRPHKNGVNNSDTRDKFVPAPRPMRSAEKRGGTGACVGCIGGGKSTVVDRLYQQVTGRY